MVLFVCCAIGEHKKSAASLPFVGQLTPSILSADADVVCDVCDTLDGGISDVSGRWADDMTDE